MMKFLRMTCLATSLAMVAMGGMYWYTSNQESPLRPLTLAKAEGIASARPPLQEIAICLRDHPNPRAFTQQSPRYLSNMFFEGLTRISPTGEMELALADAVDISEDLMTYTFLLRSSYWSNGDPVTAYDLEASWKEVLNPFSSLKPPQAFYSIRNADVAKRGKIPLDMVGIWAKDSDTLVLCLEEPNPFFLEQLSHPAFYPMHPSTLKQTCTPLRSEEPEFISNGQYMIQKEIKNKTERYLLTMNPRYTSPLD